MQDLAKLSTAVEFLLTDIDDTMTTEGQLSSSAYSALWSLSQHGVQVVPVTGRPAGWCEMIARLWPVAGVIGENGAFYFRYHQKKMQRFFSIPEAQRTQNQKKLKLIEAQILDRVKGSALASDQFCRLMDLAIDYCEDVPALAHSAVTEIVEIFQSHGAQAKVSSIHVNGWFGEYNKLTCSLKFLQQEFGVSPAKAKQVCAFAGDSPNDEPMWEFFPISLAVANIRTFADQLQFKPNFVAEAKAGAGFSEIANKLISLKN